MHDKVDNAASDLSSSTTVKVDNLSLPEIVDAKKVKRARDGLPVDDVVAEAVEVLKGISNPVRLRILHALAHEELCVGDIAQAFEVSMSAVSHQLSILRRLKLVAAREAGRQTYYRVNLWRIEGAPIPQGFVALALSVELPRRFTVMLEGYGFSSADPVVAADAGILGAVAYAPKPWLMFDLGGDAGLLQRSRSFSVFAGMTAIVVDLWESSAERRRRAEKQR